MEKSKMTTEQVSQMIEELFDEIIVKRFELIDLKRQRNQDVTELKEKQSFLEELYCEYKSIVDTYTLYLKYKKLSGDKGGENTLTELLKHIQSTKANVGNIVTEIPKN